MKHLTRWILSLVAVAAVASLTGAWTNQDGRKNEAPIVERVYQSKNPRSMSRALKHAAILRALPTFKMTLIEAIQLAEKELGGKAIYADIEVKEGKPLFQVSMFVADRFTSTKIDPFTKKVTVFTKKGSGEEEEDGDAEEEGEDEGEDEEGG